VTLHNPPCRSVTLSRCQVTRLAGGVTLHPPRRDAAM